MKEYKRLTQKGENGYWIDGNLVNQRQGAFDICIDSFMILLNRLAELEDKIESGELVENKVITYFNMARSNSKTLVDKALKYDELKAKIENGTLIELPCKVGDKIWYISMLWRDGKFIGEIYDANVSGFYVSNDFIQIEDDIIYHYHNYGEEVFLTKAEAEAKLKELKEV